MRLLGCLEHIPSITTYCREISQPVTRLIGMFLILRITLGTCMALPLCAKYCMYDVGAILISLYCMIVPLLQLRSGD